MSSFEEGLWRVYERTLYTIAGPPGTIPENNVQARASRTRKQRRTTKICTAILTITASIILLLLTFMFAAHLSFIGKGNGQCLVQKLQQVNYTLPKDVVLRLRFGATESSIPTEFVAEYEFSRLAAFVLLSEELRQQHIVQAINITLDHTCITSPTFASFVGHDTVIINQLLFGLQHGGVLHNLMTEETWNWSDEQIAKHTNRNVFDTIWNLMVLVANGTIGFMLITCLTSLLIRILLSSGVIFIYPVLYALGRCSTLNTNVAMIANIFRVAYPWLGGEIVELQRSRASVWPLVIAHSTRVLVYWCIYEASNITWNYWFYAKSLPEGMVDWAYGLFMLIEYFSMMFVRSEMTIKHYPRIIFSFYILYYSYFQATLYGLFYSNVLLFALLIFYVSCWFVFRCELPAFIHMELTEEVTRAYRNRMASPNWTGGIPSETSLFYPVTEYARPRIFQGGNPNGNNDGNDGNDDNDGNEMEGENQVNEIEEINDGMNDTAAVHGLSALMQMAGVSFYPSSYMEVPLEDNGETKEMEEKKESPTRVVIEDYISEDELDTSDDEEGLLSRP